MTTLTNSYNKSIKGGNDMCLMSFVLETIKNGGYDYIHAKDYTLEEWLSFKRYIKEHHIHCVLHNEEYVKETYIALSERAIKQWFDIQLGREIDMSWKAESATYTGSYEWIEAPVCKCKPLNTKKHGPIVHTSNKKYIK